jgi:2-amino-4-hydroxy-6-hydroxymethyldihydropteridine diphosphokinase
LTVAVLGLGGNIGDTRSLMAKAIERLAKNPEIGLQAVSALYRTPPWGKTNQPPFLNAAVRIETKLSPAALLKTVLGVEHELGRERAERWGPRTIDIDILLYGTIAIDEPGLRIPHPRLKERAFALAPLVDVMPDTEVSGRRASEWLAESDRAGMAQLAEPGWQTTN